jgi:hypothetical protein
MAQALVKAGVQMISVVKFLAIASETLTALINYFWSNSVSYTVLYSISYIFMVFPPPKKGRDWL